MKKIIVNEQQIKKIIHRTINEQTENEKLIMAVQCFLNKMYKANLKVDGVATIPNDESKTEKLLKNFQQKKGVDADGIWGEQTYNSLTNQEKQIFKDCIAETGGVIEKILNFLHLD